MGHHAKSKMIFLGLALEWSWGYSKIDNLGMLWLEPIRIGVFIP